MLAPTLTLLIPTLVLPTVICADALFYLLEYLDETLGVFGELIEIADGEFVQVEEWRGFVFSCLLLWLRSPRGGHHNRAALALTAAIEVVDIVVMIFVGPRDGIDLILRLLGHSHGLSLLKLSDEWQ